MEMIRKGELGVCPQTVSEFMPKLETGPFVGAPVLRLPVSSASGASTSSSLFKTREPREPMQNELAGKLVVKYQKEKTVGFFVSLLKDGTYVMDTTADGKFVTLKGEGWRTTPAYVKAAI